MIITTCEWMPASKPPDDEMTVLIATSDGEVSAGFREAGEWFYASADTVENEVLWWANFPAAPKLKSNILRKPWP